MKRILYPILWLGCLLFIAACSDDEPASDVLRAGSITIYVESNPWRIPARADRYSIYMESDGSGWTATCESEWVTLSATAGSGSDYLHFEVTENTNPFARESLITIADAADPTQRARLRIRQAGYNDEENATLTGDMQQKHRMGYGYDITKAYCDDQSFSKNPIIDYTKVVSLEEATGIMIITEDRRHYQELEIFSGNTVTELCGHLTKSMETKKTCLGCGKVTNSTTDIYREKNIENVYGLVRLKQLISSRTVDLAALRSQATSDDSPLFSPEFRGILAGIKAGNEESLTKLINEYGTHLVVSADLGGCLELHTSITRETSIEKEHSVTTVTKKIFGKNKGTTSSTYDDYQEEIGIDYEADLSVIGGSDATKKAMLQAIKNKKVVREITANEINQWQASFNIDPSVAGKDYNVGMVGCRLVPIYELVNDAATRQRIEQKIASYTNSCIVPEPEETPCKLDMNVPNKYWEDGNQHVLKIQDDNQNSELRAVIAKEYVPTISLEHPVVVAYPVIKGKPYYYSGLFLGDKEHKPGDVRWFGSNPIYEPNDSIAYDNERFTDLFDQGTGLIKTLYTYNGAVQLLPPDMQQYKNQTITDLKIATAYIRTTSGWATEDLHPCVKIGRQYWTEKGISIKDLEYKNFMGTPYSRISSGTKTTAQKIQDKWKKGNIPTTTKANQLVNFCNGRISALFSNQSSDRNLLGLYWGRGFRYDSDSYDQDAFIIVCSGLTIARISPSGRLGEYTPLRYFDSVCDHYYSKVLYAPCYIVSETFE